MNRINAYFGFDDWLHEEWEHDGHKCHTMIPPRIAGNSESPEKEWDGQASLKMARRILYPKDGE